MLLKIAVCLGVVFLLSACVVTPPSVEVSGPSVRPAYEVWTPYPTTRYHCPPGHAKKGWC